MWLSSTAASDYYNLREAPIGGTPVIAGTKVSSTSLSICSILSETLSWFFFECVSEFLTLSRSGIVFTT